MSIEQPYSNTATVIVDGKASILIDEHICCESGDEEYIIQVKNDQGFVVQELEVIADEIEIVRL